MTINRFVTCAILGLSVLFAQAAASEPVRIGSGTAQGFLFGHDGTCYLLLPAHEAKRRPRIRLSSSAPIVGGTADIHRPFWPGLDLAIGIVRRGPTDRCTTTLDDLVATRLGAAIDDGGDLLVIRSSGQIDRVAMTIRRTDYLTFEAEIVDATFDKDVQQGFSGMFLFIGDRPVGMAVNKIGDRRIRFTRIEEIAMNARRWLTARGTALRREPEPTEVAPRAAKPLGVLSASVSGVDDQSLAENAVTDTGAYRFAPYLPATLVLSLDDAEPTLSRLRIISAAEAGETMPKLITIHTDHRADGTPRWRFLSERPMPRTGEFDTGTLQPRKARRIMITIRSAWSDGPVRIDQVIAD